jgi:hemerythrin superfamily protein
MVDQSLEEHAEVKQLIAEILQMKRHDPGIGSRMQQLMVSVQSHVKMEEDTLFPRLTSVAPEEELRTLGMDMQRTMDELSQQELLKMAEHEGGTVAP